MDGPRGTDAADRRPNILRPTWPTPRTVYLRSDDVQKIKKLEGPVGLDEFERTTGRGLYDVTGVGG